MRWSLGLSIALVAAMALPMVPTVVADTNSCTATAVNTTCTFHCHANANNHATVYFLYSQTGDLVSGSASCGGSSVTQTNCLWLNVNNCTASGGLVTSDDNNGVCTWIRGAGVTCMNVHMQV